jgi:hypothetical protein
MTRTAILVPSLNRPQRLVQVFENIEDHTRPDHQVIFCVGDPESVEICEWLGVEFLDDSDCDDKRYVTRMNKLVEMLDNEDTIFFGSDDVHHHYGWLENALDVMNGPGEPDLVVVNDMRNPHGTQALMRRSYLQWAVFDAPDLAFHPGYRHQFADNEQFVTAMAQGTCARAMASCVEHLHPLFKQSNSLPDDETYKGAQAWSTWVHDTALWDRRRIAIARHFNLEALP